MAAMVLTASFCRSAKPLGGRQTAYPDTVERGLELRVSAEGARSWYFRYRNTAGVQRRMKLGTFSTNGARSRPGEEDCFDLEAARREVRRHRVTVDRGGDPAEERQQARQAAKERPIKTFGDLMASYFDACERGRWKPKGKVKRASTLAGEKSVYRLHVEKGLGSQTLEAVTRARIRQHLESRVDEGAGVQANRAHSLIRGALQYAVARLDRLETNPAIGLEPPVTEKPRQRVLSDEELCGVWTASQAPQQFTLHQEGQPPRPLYLSRRTAIIIQLAMLLLQRRNEIAGMRSSELDLDHATWLIPAERMKGGRPHVVPLPDRALDLIKEAIGISAGRVVDQSDFPIFPSRDDPTAPLHLTSVSHAFRDLAAAVGISGVHLHDVRRTGSSIMTSERLRILPFHRSLVLSHSDNGGGAAISMSTYDVNLFVAEKRKALSAWEFLLLQVVGEVEPGANVTRLAG